MCKFHHMFSRYNSSFSQSLLECLFFLNADYSIFDPFDSEFLCPHYCRCPLVNIVALKSRESICQIVRVRGPGLMIPLV